MGLKPKFGHEIHLCSIDTILKIILYNIYLYLCFDCKLSYKVKCGIFHLGCHVGASNVLDFGALWI
jgi:hypothetical protein